MKRLVFLPSILSKKQFMTNANLLSRDSSRFVILHAEMRAKRGKKPSMSYGGERNPKKALAMAIHDDRDSSVQRERVMDRVVEKNRKKGNGGSEFLPRKKK